MSPAFIPSMLLRPLVPSKLPSSPRLPQTPRQPPKRSPMHLKKGLGCDRLMCLLFNGQCLRSSRRLDMDGAERLQPSPNLARCMAVNLIELGPRPSRPYTQTMHLASGVWRLTGSICSLRMLDLPRHIHMEDGVLRLQCRLLPDPSRPLHLECSVTSA